MVCGELKGLEARLSADASYGPVFVWGCVRRAALYG